MTHIYQLRERTPCECRLTPADVAFLLANHRRHVRLLPTGRDGTCWVIPTGHVGVLCTPMCCFHIQPKIPIDNLFLLLGDTPPPTGTAAGESSPEAALLEMLVLRLAELLTERVQAGLHQAYAERGEQRYFLRGQLDMASQVRNAAGRKDRLHCRFDEWTVDIPCNQVPKAAAELVLRTALIGERARSALTRALAGFADVRSVPLDAQLLSAAAPDRLTECYRPLWELCCLLAEGLAGTAGMGKAACPTFLLDLERVFERYVARELSGVLSQVEGAETLSLVVQPWFRAARGAPGQPAFSLRPDLILQRTGEPLAVLDTKWKRLPATRLLTADVYQVLAYCTTVGVSHAVLIYPGRRDRLLRYDPERSSVRLSIHTLRVIGDVMQCRDSIARLARKLVQTAS